MRIIISYFITYYTINKIRSEMIQQKRSRKDIKLAVGIFILISGVSYIPILPISNEITIIYLVASVSLVIVGLLIILGTGKIKKRIKKEIPA